eukprot:59770_1
MVIGEIPKYKCINVMINWINKINKINIKDEIPIYINLNVVIINDKSKNKLENTLHHVNSDAMSSLIMVVVYELMNVCIYLNLYLVFQKKARILKFFKFMHACLNDNENTCINDNITK